jgi:hypothetical protein
MTQASSMGAGVPGSVPAVAAASRLADDSSMGKTTIASSVV